MSKPTIIKLSDGWRFKADFSHYVAPGVLSRRVYYVGPFPSAAAAYWAAL